MKNNKSAHKCKKALTQRGVLFINTVILEPVSAYLEESALVCPKLEHHQFANDSNHREGISGPINSKRIRKDYAALFLFISSKPRQGIFL